jgi:hypothetical protein
LCEIFRVVRMGKTNDDELSMRLPSAAKRHSAMGNILDFFNDAGTLNMQQLESVDNQLLSHV